MESKKVKVYRLQDREGGGPYNGRAYNAKRSIYYGDVVADELMPSYWSNNRETHPEPEGDGMYKPDSAYIYGFNSPQQLARWFYRQKNDPHLLDMMGLIVKEYEVEEQDVVYGNRQLAFLKPEGRTYSWYNKEFCEAFDLAHEEDNRRGVS